MRNKKTGQFRKFSLGFKLKLAFAKWYEINKYKIAGVVGGLIIGTLLGFALFTKYDSPQPLEMKVNAKEENITPTPKITWNDAIREVFPADEAGKMIRICMTENKRQSPYALNENTNGTYDYSWCQVNSCHKPKDMTDSEWKENLEDPRFNAKQVRKIYLSQGWSAWVVFNKNLVK